MTDHIMVGQMIALRYVVSYQILLKSARSQQGLRLAFAIWAHDRDRSNNLGLHWDGPFDRAQARRQSSAIDAFNAAISFIS